MLISRRWNAVCLEIGTYGVDLMEVRDGNKSNKSINIPDKYLKKLLNLSLDETRLEDQDITEEEMKFIREIDTKNLPYLEDREEDDRHHLRGIESIEGLQYAVNLEKVILKENNISDLSPLSDLKHIRHLDLLRNNISDLEALRNLRSLEYLDIYNNEGIFDTEALRNLENLKYLDMHFCNRGKGKVNVDPLKYLKKLEYLSIESNFIEDIYFAEGLKNLREFTCAVNHVTDMSPVEKLTLIAYEDFNDDIFLNMYNQSYKDTVNINVSEKKYIMKNPVKGLEKYIEKAKKDYGDDIVMPVLVNNFENFPGEILYKLEDDEIIFNVDQDLAEEDLEGQIILDYEWYTLSINVRLVK